jgi:hypothetical protein
MKKPATHTAERVLSGLAVFIVRPQEGNQRM